MLESIHGGFGGAPKFPQPAFLDLLLAVREAAGDADTRRAIDAALSGTLTRMALGGIFDQIGGGFHRYSVDEHWLVPHFEKMLYDNGALAETYARATTASASNGASPNQLFVRSARRICEYVLREMAAPEGGFFAAQDAEVNHREGQNYLWTLDEIRRVLPSDDAEWIAGVYGLTRGPNFRDPHHPDDAPANILFVSDQFAGLHAGFAPTDPNVARLDRLNAALYEHRLHRDQPSTDTKILTGWNGLMIAGLAVSGAALNEPRFTTAARRATEFILSSMRRPDGGIFRVFAAGRASIEGYLEDYALLIHGLLELHKAGADADGKLLRAVRELIAHADHVFGDGSGGFLDVPAARTDLFVRTRSVHDGAMPSGTSVMIHNLIDLALLTGDRSFARRAADALADMSGELANFPLGAANATRALLRLLALDRTALTTAIDRRGGGQPTSTTAQPNASTVVEILSAVESVQVPPSEPVGLILRVKIALGFHITAAAPGDGVVGAAPFRVHIVGGEGVTAFADYPVGEPFGEQGETRVYTGDFDLPIVLERSGEWKGTPLIAVTFQPCTDNACLEARTVELDVGVDRG